MNGTKIRALVVEDDLSIQEEIEDVLSAMGHDHDWAASQQEARKLIEANDYDYVLADLEIPSRPGRGFAKIEYGQKFVEQVQRIKGRGATPVIIMTGHHHKGFNLTMELLGNGAVEFISKPFADSAGGKNLSRVIQEVLDRHRRTFPPGRFSGDPPEDFRGGALAYYPDHIELCGEIILESDGPGHSWEIMQAIRQRRPNGRLVVYSAPKLAKVIDSTGQLTDNAVASCIHDLRIRITGIMLEKANLIVGRDDVIANGGRGYHLTDWLRIEERQETDTAPTSDHAPAVPLQEDPDDGMSDRQRWILGQLRNGVKLTRRMVQDHFQVGDRQAKRDLSKLSGQGVIEFLQKTRPGHYVLCGEGK